jgi:predicted hydrolase (HD superfamily)
MITREESIAIVKQHVKNENLVKHMIAVGAIMRGLAEKLGGDPDLWEAAGILHDVDYEEVGQDWTKHGAISAFLRMGSTRSELTTHRRARSPRTRWTGAYTPPTVSQVSSSPRGS